MPCLAAGADRDGAAAASSTVAATAQPEAPARSPPVAAVDLAEPGVAQAAAGRQERHRFEQVGLAGAVRPGQHHRARRRDRAVPSGSCGNRSGPAGSRRRARRASRTPRCSRSGGLPVPRQACSLYGSKRSNFQRFATRIRPSACRVTRASASARRARCALASDALSRTIVGEPASAIWNCTSSPPICSVMSSR